MCSPKWAKNGLNNVLLVVFPSNQGRIPGKLGANVPSRTVAFAEGTGSLAEDAHLGGFILPGSNGGPSMPQETPPNEDVFSCLGSSWAFSSLPEFLDFSHCWGSCGGKPKVWMSLFRPIQSNSEVSFHPKRAPQVVLFEPYQQKKARTSAEQLAFSSAGHGPAVDLGVCEPHRCLRARRGDGARRVGR